MSEIREWNESILTALRSIVEEKQRVCRAVRLRRIIVVLELREVRSIYATYGMETGSSLTCHGISPMADRVIDDPYFELTIAQLMNINEYRYKNTLVDRRLTAVAC
jgi:hypothetical protein